MPHNARVERPHAALSREVRSDDGLAGTAKDTNMTRRTVMAHLAATMQCLGVGETCQGCERDMKRGEQWNGVEAEDGEPLGWHCDDCIADWQAGREIGATTKGKSKKIELNTGDMFHGGHAGPPLLP